MGRIFISYRRSDSQDIVGRIYDRLIAVFPGDSVFRDTYSIPPGASFPLFLQQVSESALVNTLGLAPKTAEENRVFLLLPLPEGTPAESLQPPAAVRMGSRKASH